MFGFRTDFQFQIFNIIYPRKNNGMERRRLIPIQIRASQQCQKLNKHLIISRTVHLVNHKHNRSRTFPTHTAQELKHLVHLYLRILCDKIRRHTIQLLRLFILTLLKSITQHIYESKGKCIATRKFFIRHSLKIQRKYKIIFRQIRSQSPQGGSLPVLSAPIDDKVFFSVHQFSLNLRHPVIQSHHIMFFRCAQSFCIKISRHALYLPRFL